MHSGRAVRARYREGVRLWEGHKASAVQARIVQEHSCEKGNVEMALYLDPPDVVLSPNMLALGLITNFQGSYTTTASVLDGFTVTQVTYHQDSGGFAASRIATIANVLPDPIVLSTKNSTYTLPDGTPITTVQAAILFATFGQILVWDQTYCNGDGYHVFNAAGEPIEQESYLTVFHELSHAYHNAMGSSPTDLAASEALAITETNILRSELGLELRDPNNHNGGCGPGPSKPWWEKYLVDMIESVGVFLESEAAPSGMPKLEVVEDALRSELAGNSQMLGSGTGGSPALRQGFELPLLHGLASFYRTVRFTFDDTVTAGRRSEELISRLGELPGADDYRKIASGLVPASSTSAYGGRALQLFVGGPYQIIWRAYDQLFAEGKAASKVVHDFEHAVAGWSESVREYKVRASGKERRKEITAAASVAHIAFS